MNLALYLFSLFAVGRMKCSQRPTGVNAATDVSAQLPATLTSTYVVTLDCRTRPQKSQKTAYPYTTQ